MSHGKNCWERGDPPQEKRWRNARKIHLRKRHRICSKGPTEGPSIMLRVGEELLRCSKKTRKGR